MSLKHQEVKELRVSGRFTPSPRTSPRWLKGTKAQRKPLRKSLRTGYDAMVAITTSGAAKLVGFALSHIYYAPATGKAQRV